jgi:hypothetical protein
MNYKTQAQWLKRAEDVVLSMIHLTDQAAEFPKDDFKAKALRRGAIAIQLVIATRLQEVIDNLDADKIASATDVLEAVSKVTIKIEKESDKPLVRTGQGDTERMVYERDLISEVNKLSAMRKLTDMWRAKKWGVR